MGGRRTAVARLSAKKSGSGVLSLSDSGSRRRAIYEEATGATPEQAEEWMTEMERDHARYVADVFA